MASKYDIEALAKRLPPFPKIIVELMQLFKNEDDASFAELARLVRNDAVLSGKVLQVANRMRRIRAQSDFADPLAAAHLIGISRVRSIVVTTGMNKFVGGGNAGEFFFGHSYAVAVATQEVAALSADISQDDAYIAGILHDVGELCFHVLDPKGFMEAQRRASFDGRICLREKELLGTDHCEIGAELAQFWNLPAEVVDAIGTHHDADTATSPLQAAVSVGETLARALDLPASQHNRVIQFNKNALTLLGVDWHSEDMLDCYGRTCARFKHGVRR